MADLAGAGGLRVGVVGAEHPHLFSMLDPLLARGAVTVAHAVGAGLWPDAYRSWRPDSEERSEDDVLGDPSLDLVITAEIPSQRARVAATALANGTSVLADKPGATTADDLGRIVAAAERGGARWWVLFSERFEHPSIRAAVDLARAGSLGRIVHVIGVGPHTLGPDARPAWFWQREAGGGILADLGSHQADQFLAATGASADDVTIRAAAVGNVATTAPLPAAPGARDGFQDVGHVVWEAAGSVGHHRVDYLEPAGLGAWGDPRLTIIGTDATVEVRPVIDVGGQPGGEHLLLIDRDGARRIDPPAMSHWADLFLADLADDGERLMSRGHSVEVTRLALAAQSLAAPWPQSAPPGS